MKSAMKHAQWICVFLALKLTTLSVTGLLIVEEVLASAPIVPTVAQNREAANLQQVIFDNSHFLSPLRSMILESMKAIIAESYAESTRPDNLDIEKRLSHIYLTG
uniref:Uncharacterized protein n=1 Tax=Trichuris muris TaxID=70415 RepID=A0A5S6R318_TRIMR